MKEIIDLHLTRLSNIVLSGGGISPMHASMELLLGQSFISSNKLTWFFGKNSPPNNLMTMSLRKIAHSSRMTLLLMNNKGLMTVMCH